ncbi:hypothetical protein [Pseudoxanthomonas wuyuanensis]
MPANPLKSFFTALLVGAGLCLAASLPALAHGDGEPRHGGIVKSANDLSFELVTAAAEGAEIYIDDHGETLPTAGITGKLTVLGKAGKSETAVKPSGGKLVAAGTKLVSGDKAVLVLTLPTQQTVSVRFAIP